MLMLCDPGFTHTHTLLMALNTMNQVQLFELNADNGTLVDVVWAGLLTDYLKLILI